MTDAHARSPRNRDEPMAFTDRELVRGAWVAWSTFMALLLLTVSLVTVIDDLVYVPQPGVARFSSVSVLWVVLGYSAAIGGAVSLLVMFLALPLARRVARGVRRIEKRVAA